MSKLLWIGFGVLSLGTLFSTILLEDKSWITAVIAALWLIDLGLLIRENRRALTSRTAAYTFNSVMIGVLVISILGVLNFLGQRYPGKLDLTKNKLNTVSDQSSKLVKSLSKDLQVSFYSKVGIREKYRPLFDNFKSMSPKFKIEYIDPDKEPTRAKTAGVNKYDTAILQYGEINQKVEEPTEEKLTNALAKLIKDKKPTVCYITGHGEKSFANGQPDGFDAAKKGLEDQSYNVKSITLAQEPNVPSDCDALVMIGTNKALFASEAKSLDDYLSNGGRAAIALDMDLKGADLPKEMTTLLAKWYVKSPLYLVVDPFSRMMGVDASVPILATFSKEVSITKDFQANCFFPFARPLEIMPGAPDTLKVKWLAQTTPKSVAIKDLKDLAKGQLKVTDKDLKGPVNAMVSVDGKLKDSKAPRNTRLVVFGSAHFATNNYSRYGGNMDLFLNSISWLVEDESSISIRAKEDDAGQVNLTAAVGLVIFWTTVVIIPLFISILGIVIWIRRKKL
ncbi:MAG: GldG family protein [Xanthomonadaceae bacterium]|nr:GldG family protein [Xanthomonadaceae bacterium]